MAKKDLRDTEKRQNLLIQEIVERYDCQHNEGTNYVEDELLRHIYLYLYLYFPAEIQQYKI